jgi:NADPH:quinone reductase-like Zn-dependent oxidoreductase
MKITGGKGVDVILDPVGGAYTEANAKAHFFFFFFFFGLCW